jgi:PIN domain nuclease of toxin-antitoxin system
VKCLLDTHAFLWFQADSPELSTSAKSVIENAENEILLSMASIWEMAIKISVGKLVLDGSLEDLILREAADNAVALLPIEVGHVAKIVQLPFYHRDPFDRLLAAQCLALDIPIVSRDRSFESYNVERIW